MWAGRGSIKKAQGKLEHGAFFKNYKVMNQGEERRAGVGMMRKEGRREAELKKDKSEEVDCRAELAHEWLSMPG